MEQLEEIKNLATSRQNKERIEFQATGKKAWIQLEKQRNEQPSRDFTA